MERKSFFSEGAAYYKLLVDWIERSIFGDAEEQLLTYLSTQFSALSEQYASAPTSFPFFEERSSIMREALQELRQPIPAHFEFKSSKSGYSSETFHVHLSGEKQACALSMRDFSFCIIPLDIQQCARRRCRATTPAEKHASM